ncbi:hypothetical protein [Mesorhizobium sp. M0276]|uniref:hypothetical protein n=1 Tax=Mesorhizobium sp. M0276 TaxID=2956928 RepID=UPI003335CF16
MAEHSDLTLTALYNVLEKLKAGDELTGKDEDVRLRGLVLILKELHETTDRFTAEARPLGASRSRICSSERSTGQP